MKCIVFFKSTTDKSLYILQQIIPCVIRLKLMIKFDEVIVYKFEINSFSV